MSGIKVIVLEAVYESEYDECPSIEKLGVFTDEKHVQIALSAYEARKHKFNAECLLQDTTYHRYEFTVDRVLS